ncbi:MAG TPA: ABC transporter permease, partial [Paracoccus sp.]|nr:ABC transporter permease [Paracoccus sp. (in: a-proteobacteria)]
MVLGLGAFLAPFMTLAANRIVAGEGVPIWQSAGPGVTLPGLAA